MMESREEHTKSTNHTKYEWSLARDLAYFFEVFGRRPEENDPVLSVLLCQSCGRLIRNSK